MKNFNYSNFIFILLFAFCLFFSKASAQPPAPEITLEAIYNKKDGQIPTLSSLKGKIVVLDFWATWCGPCIAAFPKHNELYKKYKDKGVEFIGITDDPQEKLEGFLKRTKIDFWIARDDDQTEFTNYKVIFRPQVVVVNRDGIMVYKGVGINDEMLKEVIKTNSISRSVPPPPPSPSTKMSEKERAALAESEKLGREIFEKYQTITGNNHKEEKVKNIKTVTEIETEAGKRTETKIEDRTDKKNIKSYLISEGGIEGKREAGFDGKKSWSKNKSFRGYTTGINASLVRFPSPSKHIRLPNEIINGQEFLVVQEFFDASSIQAKSYYDPKTFLLVQRNVSINFNGNHIKSDTTYSDYREVDGFLIPFSEVLTNGFMTIKRRLLSVEHNRDIDPKIFEFDGAK